MFGSSCQNDSCSMPVPADERRSWSRHSTISASSVDVSARTAIDIGQTSVVGQKSQRAPTVDNRVAVRVHVGTATLLWAWSADCRLGVLWWMVGMMAASTSPANVRSADPRDARRRRAAARRPVRVALAEHQLPSPEVDRVGAVAEAEVRQREQRRDVRVVPVQSAGLRCCGAKKRRCSQMKRLDCPFSHEERIAEAVDLVGVDLC